MEKQQKDEGERGGRREGMGRRKHFSSLQIQFLILNIDILLNMGQE